MPANNVPLEFKPLEITLSNVITLVTMVIMFIWGYGQLSYSVSELKAQRLEERDYLRSVEVKRDAILSSLNDKLHALSERVIRVETKQDIIIGKKSEH